MEKYQISVKKPIPKKSILNKIYCSDILLLKDQKESQIQNAYLKKLNLHILSRFCRLDDVTFGFKTSF